jgi:hypothetical protein
MSGPRVFQARVNPLVFAEVDEPLASVHKTPPTPEAALRFASALNAPSDLPSIIARYREISTEPVRLSVTPVEPRLDDKLVAPLRAAKAAYMLGTPVATIALSGMVGEMLAILLWGLADVTINDRAVTPDDEKALFGRAFESLGQERRVSVLHAYGQISAEVADDFTTIRKIRNRYLHLWSQDHDRVYPDAVRCYHAGVRLAVAVFGQRFESGMVGLTPQMLTYLEQHGRLEDPPPAASEAVRPSGA